MSSRALSTTSQAMNAAEMNAIMQDTNSNAQENDSRLSSAGAMSAGSHKSRHCNRNALSANTAEVVINNMPINTHSTSHLPSCRMLVRPYKHWTTVERDSSYISPVAVGLQSSPGKSLSRSDVYLKATFSFRKTFRFRKCIVMSACCCPNPGRMVITPRRLVPRRPSRPLVQWETVLAVTDRWRTGLSSRTVNWSSERLCWRWRTGLSSRTTNWSTERLCWRRRTNPEEYYAQTLLMTFFVTSWQSC